MAVSAGRGRRHLAVHAALAGKLLGDGQMAIHAQDILSSFDGSMTALALGFKLGMGGETCKSRPGAAFGAQTAWAEGQTAAEPDA